MTLALVVVPFAFALLAFAAPRMTPCAALALTAASSRLVPSA